MAWAAIDPAGPSLAVGCAKAEQHLCLQIPGMTYSKADSIWRAPLSWAAYVAFKTVWAVQPISETPALMDWAASRWQDVRLSYALRSKLDASPEVGAEIDLIETAPEPRLFTYQRGGVEWLVTEKRCVLGDPRGGGKSPQIIRALQVLRMRGQLGGPVLLVAPPSSLLGWARKFAEWAPGFSTRVVAGTALRRRDAIEGEPADVYLIGWPSLRLHTRLASYPGQAFVRCTDHDGVDPKVTPARCEVHPKELNAISWGVVVADEAHRMQDATSKQTRAATWLARDAQYFWAATGTPILDNLDDFWPVGHALDKREFPVRSKYLDLFAVKRLLWNGGKEYLGIRPETARAFNATVQPWIRRIPREVARPHQPPLLPPVFRYPPMAPAQARIYKQLKKDLLADLEGTGTMVPASAVVRFGRMCQVASSCIDLADGEDADGFTKQLVELCLPSSKVDDLLDFLGDHPDQLVVAANSPRLVALAERKLAEHKITTVRIVGGMNHYQQDEAAQIFQRGDARVCFITSAGAEAIDLYAAPAIYFMQPDPSFASRDQKIGRVDRIGQASAVKLVYAITPGTVEERLFALGEQKEERASQVTRDADLIKWIIQGDDSDDSATAKYAASTSLASGD